MLEKSNTTRYGLYCLVVVSFCQHQNNKNLTNYRPVAVTCNSYAECKDCKIGGFCGGGCQLSHQIDFKKCCTYEEEVFSHFMKTLFIPYIKSKYNEVNQNERKAENRCT